MTSRTQEVAAKIRSMRTREMCRSCDWDHSVAEAIRGVYTSLVHVMPEKALPNAPEKRIVSRSLRK